MFSKATLKQRLFKRVFADHIEAAFSCFYSRFCKKGPKVMMSRFPTDIILDVIID